MNTPTHTDRLAAIVAELRADDHRHNACTRQSPYHAGPQSPLNHWASLHCAECGAPITDHNAAQAPQGAHLGTIDAFRHEARRMEALTVADYLRRTIGRPEYDLGDVPAETMERIAAQIAPAR